MAWDWDHLARNTETTDGSAQRPSRWTWGERGWALLILAAIAGTVLLAALTPAAHQ